MSDKYIYIVGKSDPQLATLQAIRAAGYKAGLLWDDKLKPKHHDAFDQVVPVNFDAISEESGRLAAQQLPVAGLVSVYENYVLAKTILGQALGIPSMSETAARACTDKLLMRSAFMRYDPDITPAFRMISTIDDALSFANDHGYPLIIKPTNLVKSLLVLTCNDEESLRKNVAYATENIAKMYQKYRIFDRQPQLLIEQFIVGQMYSVAAFVNAAGEVYFCPTAAKLTTAKQIGKNDNFLYERLLPASITPELSDKLFATAKKGIAALKLAACAAHVELIVTANDEVKLIEIGARIGGYRPRMYALSYGLNLPLQEVRCSVGDIPCMDGDLRAPTAVYELFPDEVGRFIGTTGPYEILEKKAQYCALKPKAGDQIGPAKNGYKAAAIVIVSDPDKERFNYLCTLTNEVGIKVGP